MGILDDALNIQDAKRSQRLSQTARKAKIEANKIKEGTYRGIDLVDGTAKVQLDDQPIATSGYRLITNAPLGDGDRVSIRPNGVGLPRADARNVAPPSSEEGMIVADILREATISSLQIFCFTGSILAGQPKSQFDLIYPVPFSYKYVNSRLVEVPSISAAAINAYGSNTRIVGVDPVTTPINIITAFDSTKDNLVFNLLLDSAFETVTVPEGENVPPTAFALSYTISFPIDQWSDLLKRFADYKDWINPSLESFYLWSECPIELDLKGNNLNFGLTISQILISSNATETTKATIIFVNIDALNNPATPFITPFPTGTVFEFSFRWRKRGNERWFSL